LIDFDVETNGLQPHSGKQEAFLWIFLDDEGNAEAIQYTPLSGGNPENRERIQAWFDRAKVEGIRAWNAKFDRAFAEQAGFDIPGDGMWYDGMIYAHAINERRSVALKAVAKELFGDAAADDQMKVKNWLKEERARRKKASTEAGTELIEPNYSDVPMEIMEPYGLEDVILTRKISDQYLPIINQTPDLKRVVDFEHGVLDALYAVEKRGIPASATDYRHLEQECISNLPTERRRFGRQARGSQRTLRAYAILTTN
jgi:DNA polymerase I-like protein with 3'-5' exonuclease and polymerase domains